MIPKISLPISVIEQPSTKKALKFRPFIVKEEKILLLAKESKKLQDIVLAMKQIIQNCCQEKDFDVDNIPLFDLEFIFLRLRAISVNNIEKFTAKDKDDGIEYQHTIDLNAVEVQFPDPPIPNKINVTKDLTIVMKYPTVDLFNDETFSENLDKNGIYELVLNCVDKVFEKDTLCKMSKEETAEFLDNLDPKSHEKLKDFLLNIPRLDYTVEYINSLQTHKRWRFSSVKDFFFFL